MKSDNDATVLFCNIPGTEKHGGPDGSVHSVGVGLVVVMTFRTLGTVRDGEEMGGYGEQRELRADRTTRSSEIR